MTQQLVLHIGLHKTGSSALQAYFGRHRWLLRRLGIFYPRPFSGTSRVHRDLRSAAVWEGRAADGESHPEIGPFDDLLERYIETIKASRAPLTILSCESWSAVENFHAPRLAPFGRHFEVRVVVFVRRPDLFLESFYRQRIRAQREREVRCFEDYVAGPGKAAIGMRAKALGWWAEAFGPERVTAIPYEPLRPGFDLFARFCDAAGVPRGLARRLPGRTWRANPSISREQAETIRRINLEGHWLTRPEVARVRKLMPGGHAAYWGEARRAEVLAAAAEDMEAVRRRYVRDGRARLFPDPPEPRAAQEQDWDGRLDPATERRVRAAIGI